MTTTRNALSLVEALENITVDEIVDLPEPDTIRLALAFEGFVEKIGAVIAQAQNQKQRMN